MLNSWEMYANVSIYYGLRFTRIHTFGIKLKIEDIIRDRNVVDGCLMLGLDS